MSRYLFKSLCHQTLNASVLRQTPHAGITRIGTLRSQGTPLLLLTPVRTFSRSPAQFKKPEPVAPKNDAIPHKTILMVTEEGLKKISLKEALKSFNPAEFDLVQVASKPPFPICKLINRKQAFDKSKQKKTKSPGSVQKELEISTVITDHDLGIKLDKAKAFLEKGYRVQFTFLKKNQKPFDPIIAKVKADLKEAGSENTASQPSPIKRLLVYTANASSKSSSKQSS